MNDRRTIATQGAEVSADFTTFPADELCTEFVSRHTDTAFTAADADPDAIYADVRHVDLSSLEPYIARPGKVSDNAVPVSQIESRTVNQCFIGSCANGQIEDLQIAAEALRGRRVANGVRLIVTPASRTSTARPRTGDTWPRSPTQVRSSPTRPAALASATTWA